MKKKQKLNMFEESEKFKKKSQNSILRETNEKLKIEYHKNQGSIDQNWF